MRAVGMKAVLAATVVGGLLAGCSSSGSGGDGEAKADGSRNQVIGASEGPSAAPSALADGMGSDQDTDGAFPRTVKHFEGSTTVKAEPKKIAVLSTGQLDDLLSLGIVPTAGTRADNAGLVPDYLADAFPADKSKLAAMADAGTRQAPNLESLAAAKPDLILANDSLGDLYPKLSKIAPTVITAGNGINWKRDLLLVGDAVGKGQAARELVDDIVADAKKEGAAVEGDPTVSMLRFTPDRTRMFGVSSFTGSIAVDMGLKRPKAQRFAAISEDIGAESIDKADGDWIFYSVQGDADKTDAGSVVAGPLWKSMKAVEAGHAVKVDDDPWYLNAGPTAARLVVRQLAGHLGK
ncbi:ABC transporter substrate-binding protein [Streptomyces cylindrosporus]|uniref:Iron-siderophore ABC transporter substrate-binding protein n=1 Tax=Streptomyces cylindrosporus TaxID=2927583 RepID=A0ABS9Y9W6_9ACTN|nr:iron-siderophore ABC transporter substrate-binding protein [Streptomyces cylindrosporus]MCI3272701.1 iron-siderophore ABC transporter substrate-binding protein [Streptomyces cylindrosporus]